MKLNLCFVVVLCFVGNAYSYDYEVGLNETIRLIEEQFRMFTNSIATSYLSSYTSQASQVGQRFQDFAEQVTTMNSPYAVAHVIQYQRNYTDVPYMLKKLINDSMDRLHETFNYQHKILYTMIPQVRDDAYEIYKVLASKRCNEQSIMNFMNDLIYTSYNQIQRDFMQIHSSYFTQLLSQYSSFLLFNDFIMQLTDCTTLSGSDVRLCMRQKDDLYYYGTIGLVRDSLGAVVTVIANLNLKVTDNVAKDVQTTFNDAFKAAFLLRC